MQPSDSPVNGPYDRFQKIIEFLPLPQMSRDGAKCGFCCCCHNDKHQSAVCFAPNDKGFINLHCSVCGPLDGRIVAAMLGFSPDLLAGGPGFRAVNPTTTFGKQPPPKKKIEFVPPASAAPHANRCHENAVAKDALSSEAKRLGVAARALVALGVGFNDFAEATPIPGGVSVENDHFTYPEVSGRGEIVGLCRRYADGSKRQRAGDGRGLAVPAGTQAEAARVGYCIFPEGHSDTAALYTMNLPAAGRPGCNSGHLHLADFAVAITKERPDFVAIIMGERDKKPNGDWPGRDGALATATRLRASGVKVCVVLPPKGFKDTRAWLNAQNVDPENIPICLALAKDYLAGVELIDGELDFSGNSGASSTASLHQPIEINSIPEKSNLDYEAGPCPHAKCIHQKGKGELSLLRRALHVRCGKAGCEACLPARRLHWFGLLIGYTFQFNADLHYVECPPDEAVATIRRRSERAGGMATVVECQEKMAVFSTVPLPGSVKITGVPHLIELINATILAIDPLARRPVKAAYGMMPSKKPKKEVEWETIGSAPGFIFFRFSEAARGLGLKSVPGRASGDKVQGTATFKLRPEWTLPERETITKWLMIGRRPPPCDPFRNPNIHDIWNSGASTPKAYKPRKKKAVPA